MLCNLIQQSWNKHMKLLLTPPKRCLWSCHGLHYRAWHKMCMVLSQLSSCVWSAAFSVPWSKKMIVFVFGFLLLLSVESSRIYPEVGKHGGGWHYTLATTLCLTVITSQHYLWRILDALPSLLLSHHWRSLAVGALRRVCSPSGTALMADGKLMWIDDCDQYTVCHKCCTVYFVVSELRTFCRGVRMSALVFATLVGRQNTS